MRSRITKPPDSAIEGKQGPAFIGGRPVVLRLDADSRPMLPEERELLATVNAEVVEFEDADPATVAAHAARIDAVMVTAKSLEAPVIRELTRCRVISRMGIGTDKIDVEEATRRGIWVTNLPGFCTDEVADHTLALLLAAARQLKEYEGAMRGGRRPPASEQTPIHRLSCRVLGIVGFGRIGQAVAHRARGFGLRILACDPALTQEAAEERGVEKAALEELLRQADFVALVCPLTPQTRGMIDATRLRTMKRSAVLINTGRGGLVREDDLAEALKEGALRFAALDVFECVDVLAPGGFPTDHPLFHLDNVLMTPHMAALSAEMVHRQRRRGAQAVVDVLCGRRPEHPVNPGVRPWFEQPPTEEETL